jgi:hypothetical protein
MSTKCPYFKETINKPLIIGASANEVSLDGFTELGVPVIGVEAIEVNGACLALSQSIQAVLKSHADIFCNGDFPSCSVYQHADRTKLR